MAAEDKSKRLAFAICDYLQDSIADGTIAKDDAEGIEVAVQCIGEAFGVDPSDSVQRNQYSIKPTKLPKIFDIFLNTQQKAAAQKAAPTQLNEDKPVSASSASSAPLQLSAETKAKAEELKTNGNKEMAAKKYTEAIDLYTQAIALNPENPVYYSNRAAAFTQASKFEEAIADAKSAVKIDPNYGKAYSRMGQAYFCLSKFQEAVDACEEGLRLEPGNASLKQTKLAAEQKLLEETSAPAKSSRAPSGGMPDFASMMSNPNFMSMAQSMMSNPDISSMLQNPAFTQMAQSMMSDPNALNNLMSNPDMARMAQSMMGSGSGPKQ